MRSVLHDSLKSDDDDWRPYPLCWTPQLSKIKRVRATYRWAERDRIGRPSTGSASMFGPGGRIRSYLQGEISAQLEEAVITNLTLLRAKPERGRR